MPLSFAEGLSDFPAVLALVNEIQARVAALPAKDGRKMKDYSDLVVAVLPQIAALVDTIEEQAAS